MAHEGKPTKEDLLTHEDDLLRGLLEAAEAVTKETVEIEIARKGKVLFRFRVRPLLEQEAMECYDKASKFVTNNLGIRVRRETDQVTYRSLLIYTATVEEDRKRLWDNKAAWEKLNVLSGPDLIDRVLLAGEKDAVARKIEEISGFRTDGELEELAKN